MMTAPVAPPSYDQAVKFEISDEKSPLKESGHDPSLPGGQEPGPAAHGGPGGQPGRGHDYFGTALDD